MENDSLKNFFTNIEKNLSKENPIYNVFETKFGKEFEKNFDNLVLICNITSFIPTIVKGIIQSGINSPGTFFSFIFELLLFAADDESNKSNSKIDLSKMQTLTTELLKSISPDNNDLESVKIDQNSKLDKKNSTENNEATIDLSRLQILERVTSYFILTLYAYMEIYSMELFKFFVGLLDVNELYKFMSNIRPTENPAKRIKKLLTNIEIENNSNLQKLIDDIIKDKEWEEYYREFTEFMNIRNYIAHRNPSGAFEFMKAKLTKSWENAKLKAVKTRDNINISDLSKEILQAFFRSFKDTDYEYIFLLQNAGHSCYRYLSLIDKFLILIQNKNIRIIWIA